MAYCILSAPTIRIGYLDGFNSLEKNSTHLSSPSNLTILHLYGVFDSESLRLRAEFLFLVPTTSFRVSESVRKVFDLGSIENDGLNEGFESRLEVL